MNKLKVKQISETLFQVGERYSVKIQTKKGRTLLICNCQNDSRFCNESPFCYHKQLVTEYLALKPIKEDLDKLINEYKGFAGVKGLKINAGAMLDDLIKLKRTVEGKND